MGKLIENYFNSAKSFGELLAHENGATGLWYQAIVLLVFIIALIVFLACWYVPMLVFIKITSVVEKSFLKGFKSYKRKIRRLQYKVGVKSFIVLHLMILATFIRKPGTFIKWLKK